jgi:gamma-glutamyl:cysteine ligase YbdK (ATP-grasp superfamily)
MYLQSKIKVLNTIHLYLEIAPNDKRRTYQTPYRQQFPHFIATSQEMSFYPGKK